MLSRLARWALLCVLALAPLAAQDKPKVPWEEGPCTGRLGTLAEIQVPEGFVFTGAAGAKTFLELTQNIPSGKELGILASVPKTEKGDSWFVIFKYSDVGYIKDDEKDKLDAAAILDSIKEGTAQANEARRKKGWPTVDVVGWNRPPFYDGRTHNLTWAILGREAGTNDEVINHSVRILGRGGYMNADLVLSPKAAGEGLPAFERVMGGFSYLQGQRYAEFKKGDRIAAIGLTALVAGGAGAALAKSGLLGKFWKLIVAGVVALGVGIKRLFTRKSEQA